MAKFIPSGSTGLTFSDGKTFNVAPYAPPPVDGGGDLEAPDFNRTPVEIVEIRLPRCINSFGEGPCQAVGSGDAKCYNTRATCRDTDNYRDTPDRHLTPDLLLSSGDTIASGDIDRSASFFAGFDVRFDTAPDGIIWEQGGSADFGAYLGVTNGNLVFRAGDGTTEDGGDVGRLSVSAAPYAGANVSLFVAIDFTAASTSSVSLWVFDPVALSITSLGSDEFAAGASWAGADGGAIGQLGGSNAVTGESVEAWNGVVSTARLYSATPAPADMSDNFAQSLYLGRGEPDEPTDEIYILPCLKSVTPASSRINLNGSDKDYDPLGRRATLDFSARDFVHSDITQDPYYAERTTDPRTLSTFWRKWLRRQKFGRVGAMAVVHDGYAGEAFADYRKRSYVLNRANYNEDGVEFYARDVMSRVEFNKVQVPAVSTGQLVGDIDEVVTSLALVGDVTAEYPATGTLRINDEIMTYTGRTFSTNTTFTGLARGTDGSDAAAHEEADTAQICRRYTNATVTEVLTELLVDDGGVSAQLVDLAGIEAEDTTYLAAYVLNALITEPTGAADLIGRLSEEASFFIWWDERSQKVRVKASRALAAGDIEATFTDEDNIIANSFALIEKPNQRVNFINFFFNPRNRAGDLSKPANYANVLQVLNSTTSQPTQYGGQLQLREIFSTFLGTNAQANQTASRLALRYADVPLFATFSVDAKDRSTWVGDYITISTPLLVTPSGHRDIRRWIIVEAAETVPGHVLQYTAADVTLDGAIYTITENGIGNYTPELFAAGNTFITNNDGTNADGSQGATIS